MSTLCWPRQIENSAEFLQLLEFDYTQFEGNQILPAIVLVPQYLYQYREHTVLPVSIGPTIPVPVPVQEYRYLLLVQFLCTLYQI